MNAQIPVGRVGQARRPAPGSHDRAGHTARSTIDTLARAHEVMALRWPGRDASAEAWRAHHEFAAALYAHVAEVDAAHHHEALFWAGQEQEAARGLAQVACPSVASVPGEGDEDV